MLATTIQWRESTMDAYSEALRLNKMVLIDFFNPD